MVTGPHLMLDANAGEIVVELEQLRTELVELAYSLDVRGRHDAADVAVAISGRLGELSEKFAAEGPASADAPDPFSNRSHE